MRGINLWVVRDIFLDKTILKSSDLVIEEVTAFFRNSAIKCRGSNQIYFKFAIL